MFIQQKDLVRNIGKDIKTFIIAEIGQNHQGDINIAKQLILRAKEIGADCVKFQKTCPEEKFTERHLNLPYISENSFGATYGEHKEFLEFSKNQFIELQKFCEENSIFFSSSAMDIKSLHFLNTIKVPFIKIGSGEANNFILIEKAAALNVPLIISTGMQNFDTVKTIYNIVSKYHKNFALLHCLSSYPSPYEELNLNVINLYKKEFPDITIGYSGHELGTHVSVATVAMGAKIIERHITLDKNQKGSDHRCSLIPEEFAILVENVRNLENAMGVPVKTMQQSEVMCYEKLGKSIVYARDLQKNSVVLLGCLNVKVSYPRGIDGSKLYEFIGKKLKTQVFYDDIVSYDDFY